VYKRQDNKNVHVTITDSGKGIHENIMNKLFDPFFTTKDVGEGTGLGLYVSHSIIQKHEGSIDVSNAEGKGASFHISLPVDMRGNRAK